MDKEDRTLKYFKSLITEDTNEEISSKVLSDIENLVRNIAKTSYVPQRDPLKELIESKKKEHDGR